jgi:hypothetical protein
MCDLMSAHLGHGGLGSFGGLPIIEFAGNEPTVAFDRRYGHKRFRHFRATCLLRTFPISLFTPASFLAMPLACPVSPGSPWIAPAPSLHGLCVYNGSSQRLDHVRSSVQSTLRFSMDSMEAMDSLGSIARDIIYFLYTSPAEPTWD